MIDCIRQIGIAATIGACLASPALATSPEDARAVVGQEDAADEGHAEAFDELHRLLARFYPSFADRGIDWDAVARELRPAALAATDDAAFAEVCIRLVARLEDDDVRLMPGTRQPPLVEPSPFGPGLACLVDDRDRLVVFHVTPGGSAEALDIRPGDVVSKIDGRPAMDVLVDRERVVADRRGFPSPRALRRHVARTLLRSPSAEQSWSLTVPGLAGGERTVDVFCTMVPPPPPRAPVPIGPGPDHQSVDVRTIDGVLWIAIRRFGRDVRATVDRVVAGAGTPRAIVLDLRGGTGGSVDVDADFVPFDRTLEDRPQNRPYFSGPMAVLVDEGTSGAGELFASWFRAKSRARIYGTRTAGSLPGDLVELDVAGGRWRLTVPTEAGVGLDGAVIDGPGIQPDVEVRMNADDITMRRDTLLQRILDDLSRRTS